MKKLLKFFDRWRWGVILLGIMVIALWYRLVQLDQNPPSLNWDEVSHGYNAFSIWKSGRDEWGTWFPAIFRAFGDYKLPAYIYFSVPWVAIGGLSAWTVRMTSVLAGTGSVLFTYLVVKKIFELSQVEKKAGDALRKPWFAELSAVSSALLIAVSPWTVFLSRIAVEANLGSFLTIAGTYFFLRGVDQIRKAEGKSWAFSVAGLLLGLSLFSYNSFRLFTPFLAVGLVWLYQHDLDLHFWPKRLQRKLLHKVTPLSCHCHLTGVGLFLLFMLGMVAQMTFGAGKERLLNISVIDEGAIATIEQARNTSQLPERLNTLVNNRPVYLLTHTVENYFSFFDPGFWFIRGGDHYQFSVQGFGLLFPVTLPVVLLGMVSLIWLPPSMRWLLIGWLLLAPLPASPTRDNPHTLRIITMSPLPFIFGGLGIAYLIYFLKEILGSTRVAMTGLVMFLVGLVLSTVGFWTLYTEWYRLEYVDSWQYGSAQMVSQVKELYPDFNKILVTKKYGEVHEFFAFYWPFDPADFQQTKQWDYHDNWYWVNEYDKFMFVDDWEIEEVAQQVGIKDPKVLLVTTYGNAPEGWRLRDVILSLDYTVVYAIYDHPLYET